MVNSTVLMEGGASTTTLKFLEAGTFRIVKEYSHSGTFTYKVDDGEVISIPATAAAFEVDETTTVEITITQGSYFGSGTEYSITAWLE